jgi:hypothetical protein
MNNSKPTLRNLRSSTNTQFVLPFFCIGLVVTVAFENQTKPAAKTKMKNDTDKKRWGQWLGRSPEPTGATKRVLAFYRGARKAIPIGR